MAGNADEQVETTTDLEELNRWLIEKGGQP